MTALIVRGDARSLPVARGSVDSIVTDPPYELGFMGRSWDASGVAYDVGMWRRCLAALKPGGNLLAFGGTRTYHRMACAIEDAGFEIRDSVGLLGWAHGQGFPKHKNALKPAWEPIVVARKPLAGTVEQNVRAHGTGALNIDACRVNPGLPVPGGGNGQASHGGRFGSGVTNDARPVVEPHFAGRWPSNLVLTHHPECADQCHPWCHVAEIDQQSGVLRSGSQKRGAGLNGSDVYGAGDPGWAPDRGYTDQGGASRFFPVFRYEAKAPAPERPRINGVSHPTVKPLDLMRWLVRLVTPPGGVVLDPFAGSGTTVEACLREGFHCVAVERDEDHLPLIQERVRRAARPWAPSAPRELTAPAVVDTQMDLFGGVA